jgi:hypothetical protein
VERRATERFMFASRYLARSKKRHNPIAKLRLQVFSQEEGDGFHA